MVVDLFDLPCRCAVGPAHIHAPQHRGPVLALGAACASVHLDIAVVGVHLAREQERFQLGILGFLRPPARMLASTSASAPLSPSALRHLPQHRPRRSASRSSIADIIHCRSRCACARASAAEPSAGSFQKSGRSESAFSSARRFSAKPQSKTPPQQARPTAGSFRPWIQVRASCLSRWFARFSDGS